MANWRERINLHGVLHQMNGKHDLSRLEEECPKEVKDALAAEVEKSTALRYLAPQIRRAKSIAAVNRKLEAVFDEADVNLVWCGI